MSSPKETIFEALLTRGDRKLGAVIETAWKNGSKFDAWREHFNFDNWLNALTSHNIDPDFYTSRHRKTDEHLPWDHLSAGVNKRYLQTEYEMSMKGETRVDCRESCFYCGIIQNFDTLRPTVQDNPWFCPSKSIGEA